MVRKRGEYSATPWQRIWLRGTAATGVIEAFAPPERTVDAAADVGRALAINAPRAVEDLTTGRPIRSVDASGAGLSAALGFSLDLWWLYLFYLRVIGPSTAVGIALVLALGAAAATDRGFVLASRCPDYARHVS